ncbi:hypothetical protein OPT61_g6624 [Boeremia exigua]|uniref:Uncharacterized protein n=1 Tax=Boeremia exigua TaxID=749465 RepID=A0ACC2I648_9PLEO|nr:hypothetical protein OPT61_g6624 [Boeremia exigua]
MDSNYPRNNRTYALSEPVHPRILTKEEKLRVVELEKEKREAKRRLENLEELLEVLEEENERLEKQTGYSMWRSQHPQFAASSSATPRASPMPRFPPVLDIDVCDDELPELVSYWFAILIASKRALLENPDIFTPITSAAPSGFPSHSELTGLIEVDFVYLDSLYEFRHWNALKNKNGRKFRDCDVQLLDDGKMSLIDLFKRGAVKSSWYKRLPFRYSAPFLENEQREIGKAKTALPQRLPETATPRSFSAQPVPRDSCVSCSLNNSPRYLPTASTVKGKKPEANLNKIKEDLEELAGLVEEYQACYNRIGAKAESVDDSLVDVGDLGEASGSRAKGKERARDV